jgi:hypothetical protein
MADQPSLTVLGGPLGGRRFAFENGADSVLIGSDASCTFRLELPGVSPIHARVRLEPSGIVVYDTQSPRGLFVNDDKVTTQIPIRNGDILWLGTPGEPGVVMIQCRVPPGGLASASDDEDDEAAPSTGETQAVAPEDEGAVYAEPIVEETVEPAIAVSPDPEPEPTVAIMPEPEPTLAVAPEAIDAAIDATMDAPAPPTAGADAFFDDSATQAMPAPTPWAPPPSYDEPTSFTVEPPPTIIANPSSVQFEDETDESALATMAMAAPSPLTPPPDPEPEPEPEPEPSPAVEPTVVVRPPAPPTPPSRPPTPVPPPRPAPSAPRPGAASSPRLDPAARPKAGAQSMPPRAAAGMAPRRPTKGGGGGGMGMMVGIGGAVLLVAGAAAVYFLFLNKPAPTQSVDVVPTVAPPTGPPPTAPPATAAPAPAGGTEGTEAPTAPPTAAPPEPVEVVTMVSPTKVPTVGASPTPAKAPTKSAQATAPPTVAPPNPAMLAAASKGEGQKALAAGQYDAAIGFFDEALRLAPGDADATAGRARAVAARDASRKRFVAGTTSVKSGKAGKADLSGFESSDVKVAGALETSGQISFEVKPDHVKPGESYVVRVTLKNDGKKDFKIAGVTISTMANGNKSGGPVSPRAKEVNPQATVVLEELPGVWGESTTSWSMEVVVTSNRGDTFRNQLSWR